MYYDSRNKDYNSAANLLLFNGKVINTHLDRRVRGEGGFVQLEVNIKDDCMVGFLVLTKWKYMKDFGFNLA